MGVHGSKPGCFKAHVTPTEYGEVWKYILGGIAHDDCDCHPRGTCPHGEPSMPPLEEFMDMKLPPHIDCPTLQPLPVLPQRHSWRDFRSDITWESHGHRRQEGLPNATRYREAVLGAYDSLPASRQGALQRSFGAAVGRLREAPGEDATDQGYGLDPPLVLGLLIADPYRSARPVVESLPAEMGNTLLRCAERAVDKTLERTRLQMPPHTHYGAYLQHFADQWRMHTPAGLSRSAGAVSARDADDAALNSMCDHVYRHAVANVEARDVDQRYVASYGEIAASLEWETATAENNSFLRAMSAPPAALDGLTWAQSDLMAAFGPAFPALTVGMGFLTLSLYTGTGGLWA